VKDAGSEKTDLLLVRLLEGDGAAWERVVEEYSGFLLAVCRKTFAGYGVRPTGQDIEDAVADVWKNLFENDKRVLRQCIERRNFVQTLQVLARHRSIDIMRKRQAGTVALNDGHAPATEPPPEPADFTPKQIRAAVGQLPHREKILVNLFFLQGKKYREIAALTGIPQNSIGPTLARALARLRKHMGPEL
jgi:RNA polymerase sigma-70 factor (ECF subfamily)